METDHLRDLGIIFILLFSLHPAVYRVLNVYLRAVNRTDYKTDIKMLTFFLFRSHYISRSADHHQVVYHYPSVLIELSVKIHQFFLFTPSNTQPHPRYIAKTNPMARTKAEKPKQKPSLYI
jgi:hypothetical protein